MCNDRVFCNLVLSREGVYCGLAQGPLSSEALGGHLVCLTVELPLGVRYHENGCMALRW
jgi:hypothetical protein